MEEGIRRAKGVSKATSRPESTQSRLMYERRPLKTVTLTPPAYLVPPQVLLESYLEKDIRYAGVVPNIPVHLDATNRTEVLRVIDRGKREETIPWMTSYENDAIFCLSAQNVKISRRNTNEELLLRLPIHELAATCYIRDDDQHILAIKFGDIQLNRVVAVTDLQEMCQLAVLYCDSRGSAEELCSLVGQCFQLVYTDATMQFLDTTLSESAAGMSIGSSTIRSEKSSNSTPSKIDLDQKHLGFLSVSSLDLDQNTGTLSSGTSRSLPQTTRRSSTARSESELSAAANETIQDYMKKVDRPQGTMSSGTASSYLTSSSYSASDLSVTASELLHDYMKKLYHKLNMDELRRFAMLVKAWHTNMAFTDFCEKVLELYGPERKYLLLGMKPFIPEKDWGQFETFLEKIGLSNGNNLNENTNNNGSRMTSRRGYNMMSFSSASVAGSSEDQYDQMLKDISHDIDSNFDSLKADTYISSKRT